MMSFRDIGKASFVDLQDRDGRIQVYLNADEPRRRGVRPRQDLGPRRHHRRRGLRLQDAPRRDLRARQANGTLLAKALEPLPEKFHGLKDPEQRYRRRYLDLVMNPEVMETFKKRTQIIRADPRVPRRPRLHRGRDARSSRPSPRAPPRGPSSPSPTPSTSSSTCASPPSSTSSAASSAAWSASTRWARTSATRASTSATTPSSR